MFLVANIWSYHQSNVLSAYTLAHAQCFDQFHLMVYFLLVFTTGFSVTVTPAQSNVLRGNGAMLICNHSSADRAPAITWERLDGMPISQVRFEVGGRSGEILRITFAEEADSGVYVCRVTSFQGVQTGTAEIFVGEFINEDKYFIFI